MSRRRLYPVLPGGILSEARIVASAAINDCDITTAKLADSAVTTVKINNGAVTYAKVQNVTAARLLGRYDALAGVVQEVALGTGLSFDSGTGVVNASTALSDCSVLTQHIKDSAVSTVKILDSSVTYAKIQAVTASRLLGRHDTTAGIVQEISVLGGLSFDTTNDALRSDTGISDCTIVTSKLADSAVTTIKISDSQVTYAKIQAVAASRLLGRHDTTAGVVEEVALGGSLYFDTTNDAVAATRIIELNVSDTTLTTGDGKIKFNIPSDMDSWDLIDADACVDTNTSAVVGPTFQIRNATQAADMLSTKITIDTSELTSFTAAIQPVIDTANDSVVTGDRIEIDIDSAGTAAGLRIITAWRKF